MLKCSALPIGYPYVFSEGSEKTFAPLWGGRNARNIDIELKLNVSVFEAFDALVTSDVLVMGRSSFSYSAALIAQGDVYFPPGFWHPPLKEWNRLG